MNPNQSAAAKTRWKTTATMTSRRPEPLGAVERIGYRFRTRKVSERTVAAKAIAIRSGETGMSASHCETADRVQFMLRSERLQTFRQTHRDKDPDSRRVAVQADDLDWAAFAGAGPVLDCNPHQYRQTEEVGVSVVQHVRLVQTCSPLCARRRFEAHTTEVAAPRRVKSYEYGRPSR